VSRIIDHPSNRLYRGECHNFLDAIETYIAALEWERGGVLHDNEEVQFLGILDDGLTLANKVKAEYLGLVQYAEKKLIEKWRKSGDKDYTIFADALEDGDYSALAI